MSRNADLSARPLTHNVYKYLTDLSPVSDKYFIFYAFLESRNEDTVSLFPVH